MSLNRNTPIGAGPLAQSVRRHWRLVLSEGILLLILGALAILLPPVAGLVVTVVLGWLLFLAGLFGLVVSVLMRSMPGFWWSLISSVIAIFAGAMLVAFPVGGIVSLTLLLAIFLFADGLITIMLALDYRSWAPGNWGWMLLNGVLDLVLAVAIFAFLPAAAAWVVGTIVGIDMIFSGISLVAIALAARRA